MRKALTFASVVLITLASSIGSFAATNYFSNSTLDVVRTQLSNTECEWTYYLHCVSSDPTKNIRQFEAGLLVDDTDSEGIGNLTGGHYYGYESSFDNMPGVSKPIVTEEYIVATWKNFTLANGSDAWFKFKTDLMSVDTADCTARDAKYSVCWNKQTPVAAVPEPGSLVALLCGCVGLFANRKKFF